MSDRVLTIPEASKRLGVATVTGRRWIEQGYLPARRFGKRRIGVVESELEKWIAEQPRVGEEAER